MLLVCISDVARGGYGGHGPETFSFIMITRWHYYIDAVMITRWRNCLNAVLITRWQDCLSALPHHCENGHWMGSLDSECVLGQRTLDCKKKTFINISKPQGKTTNYENGMWCGRKREIGVQKERERGREDAVLYEKGG